MQRTDTQSLLDGLRDIDVYLTVHQKGLRARLLAAYDFRPAFRYQSLSLPAIELQFYDPAITQKIPRKKKAKISSPRSHTIKQRNTTG